MVGTTLWIASWEIGRAVTRAFEASGTHDAVLNGLGLTAGWISFLASPIVATIIGRAAFRRTRYGIRDVHKQDCVVGYRAWDLRKNDDGSLALKSVSHQTFWKAGKPMIGRPYREDEGVHAFKSLEDLLAIYPGENAYGTIALAGTIIEHENGYRAEGGYPIRVVLKNKADAEAIRRAYGCETLVVEDDDPIAEMMRRITLCYDAYSNGLQDFFKDSEATALRRDLGFEHYWSSDGWPALAYALRAILGGYLVALGYEPERIPLGFGVMLGDIVIHGGAPHHIRCIKMLSSIRIIPVEEDTVRARIGKIELQDALQERLRWHMRDAITIAASRPGADSEHQNAATTNRIRTTPAARTE